MLTTIVKVLILSLALFGLLAFGLVEARKFRKLNKHTSDRQKNATTDQETRPNRRAE